MKLPSFISTLFLILIFIAESCTGNKSATPTEDTVVLKHVDTIYVVKSASIFGLWIGSYNVTDGPDAGEQNFYYSFELHKDKTIQVTGVGGDGMTYYGMGTWNADNKKFSAQITTTNLTHTGVPQTITASYDSTNETLSGSIVNDVNNYKATFKLEKVQ